MYQLCYGFIFESLLQNATGIITKCDSYFITNCDRNLLQNPTSILLENTTVLLQNPTFFKNCNSFITKCDSYYKTRKLLQLWQDNKQKKLPRSQTIYFFVTMILERLTSSSSLVSHTTKTIYHHDHHDHHHHYHHHLNAFIVKFFDFYLFKYIHWNRTCNEIECI